MNSTRSLVPSELAASIASLRIPHFAFRTWSRFTERHRGRSLQRLLLISHAAGQLSFHPPLEIRIEKALQVAVEDMTEIVLQVAGAAVLDALRGMQKVVADL